MFSGEDRSIVTPDGLLLVCPFRLRGWLRQRIRFVMEVGVDLDAQSVGLGFLCAGISW